MISLSRCLRVFELDAAKAIAPEPAVQKAWMEAQKDALKRGRLDGVLQALARHFKAAKVDEDQAPVRRCHRCLIGRRNQLNYREALANRSADRLWRSKARIATSRNYSCASDPELWWRVEHAEYMLGAAYSIVETATGRPIGPRSAEAARPPQIQNRPPISRKKSQRDCITLDRTPNRSAEDRGMATARAQLDESRCRATIKAGEWRDQSG